MRTYNVKLKQKKVFIHHFIVEKINIDLTTGIDNLKKVYSSTPDFCDEKALDDVTRQLYEVWCVLCVRAILINLVGCVCISFVCVIIIVDMKYCHIIHSRMLQ